jgi:hypothetical protein
MEEKSLKLAQQDIEDALKVITEMEDFLSSSSSSNDLIKEKFLLLSEKVQKLETILKDEGIL